MLIHRISADTLEAAARLSREVATRLDTARAAGFKDEAEAEAFLWGIVALMQEQAGVTARILTAAIDARDEMQTDQTAAEKACNEERS